MAERPNAPVLKTGRLIASGVQIPLPPPLLPRRHCSLSGRLKKSTAMKKLLEKSNPWVTLTVLVLVCAVLNFSIHVESGVSKQLLKIICLVVVILLSWTSGLSLQSLGITSGKPRQIVQWSVLCIVAVFATTTVLYFINSDWFLDSRYNRSASHALFYIFITIPFATVLIEEFIFRGVLWGYIREHWGDTKATLGSSLLFGLWHVLAARTVDNSVLSNGDLSHSSSLFLTIVGTVVVTFCAGILLCELRRRTNSLWVPIVFHWSINASAVAMAYVAWN